MGIEIELKFRVADHAAIAENLQALGAAAGATVDQVDIYFRHPCRDFAATDEAFRLRGVGPNNHLTYKGPKQGGPTKTREEIELPIGAGSHARDEWLTLLARLGFTAFATIRKTRRSFTHRVGERSVEIALDDAGELGSFVEVESLAEDAAELPLAQAAVLDLARELRLTSVEPRSYLRMVLERGAIRSTPDSA